MKKKKRRVVGESKFLYATTNRGRNRATKAQHKLLETRKLPHTHVIRSKYGTIYRKRVYA